MNIRIDINFWMSWKRTLYCFLAFGLVGCLAEIVVGVFHEAVFGLLWIYYNGFYTSIESFFYFGALGTLMFLLLNSWFAKHNRKKEKVT